MFNVWNTLYPDDVKQVIAHANSQRYSIANNKVRENSIAISDTWKEQLQEMPFVSKQKGRMAHLLKQKSKVQAPMKERVKYDVFDFIPQKRVNMGDNKVAPLTQAEERKNGKTGRNAKKIEPTVLEKYDEEMEKK